MVETLKYDVRSIIRNGIFDIFHVYELPVLHSKARTDNKKRVIDSTSQQGFLCYGQRRSDYPIIPLQAVFSMAINDNNKNDEVCLLLDVYDHHIDRVIAKKVITRKDFRVANKIDMFTLGFIPPSKHAVLEFRIYYMGGSTITLDKIAIIDANFAVVVKHGQFSFSSIDHLIRPPIIEDKPPLPKPPIESGNKPKLSITTWGDASGTVVFNHEGFVFNMASFGSQSFGDNVLFASIKCPHRGKISVELEKDQNNMGIMIRNSLLEGENYIYLDPYYYKYRVDGNEETDAIDSQWSGKKHVKIIRKGDDFVGQVSDNGSDWHAVFSKNVDMESKKQQAIGVCSSINGIVRSMGISDFVADFKYQWNWGIFSTEKF